MDNKRFETFIKLMKMTTSNQDNEALVALRKANAIMMESNLDWEQLLKSKVTVKSDVPQTAANQATGVIYNNADEINAMFAALFKKVLPGSSFRAFIDDVHKWWESKGFLTEKQYNAILKSYERI